MAKRGQDYALEISPDGGSYTKIGKLTGIDLSREKETINTNNFDDPDDETSLPGMRSWGLSGAALFVHDDAGQQAAENAYAVEGYEDAYYFRLTPISGVAGKSFTGQGHVTNLSLEFQTNEVIKYSLDVQGTGQLTVASVSGV